VTQGWGILGTGRVADGSVAPALAQIPDAELVGCVSREYSKAQEFANRHGGRAYEHYSELLADDSVEIIYVATPNALHADQVVAAAEAGKHIFADKPLALSALDAARAITAAERAGVKLGINFQTRHHVGMAEIKQSIASGEIGEPLVVECEVSPGRGQLRGWRTDPDLAGLGTINNLGVHAYDLLRWLLGQEIVEVTVLTNAGRRHELETVALALLRFENGTLGYVNANQAVPDYRPDLAIYGGEGRITGRSVTRPFIERGEITVRAGEETRSIETQTLDAFTRSVEAFNQAVTLDEEPNPSGLDGLRSVELTDAMALSAREGRSVEVGRNTPQEILRRAA
jgi:1,5-anhydro-D-fructose reductase (1,5-anhydro-D-mannitol-forming)